MKANIIKNKLFDEKNKKFIEQMRKQADKFGLTLVELLLIEILSELNKQKK